MAGFRGSRYGLKVANESRKIMSYPMNEFETDREKPCKPANGWISHSSGTVGTDVPGTGDRISAMAQVRDFHNADNSCVDNTGGDANAVRHRNGRSG
jgi:hypothetical protein